MTFMDSLGANSAVNPRSSGIFDQPKPQSDDDVLSIVNKLKDREMLDFQNKANFMSDLSLRQEQRMRNLYDPDKHRNPQDMPTTVTPGTINSGADLADTRSGLTGGEKAELGVRQQGFNLESQKLNQQGKLGQEALDIKTAQEKLNQQKSDQINTEKQADMQRKIEESNKKIELAQEALKQKNTNAEAQLQAHKDMAAAVEERHKLELAQKDHQFQITSELHQKQIDDLEKKMKDSQNSTTTTELDPSGNKKTVTTKKGDTAKYAPQKQSDGSYLVYFPDGTQHLIPSDKLDDWNQNHQSIVEKALSQAGGGGDE